MGLIKKLRKAKKEAPPNEKPTVVKTHLRDMIIVPEMIGSMVGIYNGKVCSCPLARIRHEWLSRCGSLGFQFC
jgi:ribosomal protein S19